MPLLITVFACDECGATIGLKTEADWQAFDENWWEGFAVQFCPICAEKPETLARRLADSRMTIETIKPVLEAAI